jgi:Flp pilus assembly protein TadD
VSYRHLRSFGSLLLLSLVLLPACRRKEAGPVGRRLALVRFENLSSDPGLDWLSLAIPGTLAAQLAGSPEYVPFVAMTDRDVRAGQANLELLGYYTLVNGRLQITGDLRVPAAGVTARTFQVSGDPNKDSLSLIDSLARQLGPQAKPFPTSNVAAARAFWSAGDAATPQESAARIEAAIQADPSFSTAYLSGIESAAQRGDAAAASRLLGLAKAASGSFDAASRSKLDLLAANLRGDAPAKVKALTELAQQSPSDAGVWRELGAVAMGQRNYPGANAAFTRVLQIAPGDTVALNLMGYSKAFSEDFEGARAAFEEYAKRSPQDGNAADSLGDIYFYFGRFPEASKSYQQAHKLNPALLGGGDLYRAALAEFFGGKQPEADALSAEFLQFRAANRDAIGPIREAVWEASTGRLDRAVLRLQNFLERKDAVAEARSVAVAQLALFALAQGKTSGLQPLPAASPAGRALQFYAAFLSQPDTTPEAWEGRTAPLVKTGQTRVARELLGYALLLHGHYAAAVPVWQTLLAASRPETDGDARVMLAWAYAGAGRNEEARKLLERFPIPPRMAEPGLAFLTMLKIRDLRK